jgi:hypothetical protein
VGKWGSGEVGKWGSGEKKEIDCFLGVEKRSFSGKIVKLRILRARSPLKSHFCRRYVVILSLSFPKMGLL